ncbi:MAG TPA: PAS domain S-box protein [Vicinamibacterales bacterium]|nr:PAS domain S-box protein [Vicinamibacterales bacterium]
MEPILQSIFDSAVDGIIVIDAKGLIKAFNPAAEHLFGYRADEVLGQNVKLLMPSPDREQHDRYLHNYLTTKVPRIIGTGREVRGRRKDGSTFPLHLSVGEMQLDGQPAFTGILHDLSRRVAIEEALRQSEERVRAIVESAIDAIIVIDDRGAIQAFNPSAERLFGYRISEVLGRNVNMLMPSPDHERHDGYLHHYLTTGEQKIIGIGREVTALRKNGTTFPVHLSVGEMKSDDGRRSFTGILHDLSDRVLLEQRLTEQKALAKLGEMAAVVAHEVKNPIAGIRGALQVITSRMPDDQRDRAILIDIITRLDALNRIVQDMLMFARPRALRKEALPLASLLRETASLIERDPSMLNLEIGISGTADIIGDREMLQVVFQNILMNAAQAMEGQGRIDVTITQASGRCRIAVADRGPGMPDETREKAFDAFFTTKHRGTGLGLPIAKGVVDAHGGTIHIDVRPEGGTTISVELPLPV